MVQGCDWPTSQALADKLNVLPLDVLDDHNLNFVQEVEREVGNGVPQNRLLHQQNVAAGLFNLLHDVQNVRPFFLQDSIRKNTSQNTIFLVSYTGNEWERDRPMPIAVC